MTNETSSQWTIPDDAMAIDDPLLACLIILAKHFQTPCSATALTERLPLVNNKLTPALFVRAAERARLAAEINKIALEDIHETALPAILLLEGEDACVLVEKSEKKCIILTNKTGHGEVTLTPEELSQRYVGFAIFVKPTYKFTRRAREALLRDPKDWFWPVMTKSWPLYVEVLLASILVNLFGLAFPLFTMNVYDRVVPNQAIDTMWVLASGIAIVFGFDLFLKSLRAYYIDLASKKMDERLSAIIFEHIMGIQMGARPSSVGAFANVIQSFEAFRDFITSTTITVLVDLPFVFLYLLVIFLIAGNLVFVPLTVIPLVFLVGWMLQYPLTEMTKTSFKYAQEKHATLIESLAGIEAIKSTGAEGTMQGRFEQVVGLSSELGAKLRMLVNASMNFTNLTQQVSSVILVIFGVYKISDGELTVGALIACTILSGKALASMGQVSGLFTRYYQSVQALVSINQLMQLPADIDDPTVYLHRPNLEGNIEFKNVEFKYPDQPISALNKISFKIKKGEHVAIIGRIGSGKSTIAKLIMGLYKPNSGSIYMDGTDYLQLNPADLRRQIGYMQQDVLLFYGSIKDNIRLGAPYIADEKIMKAAAIAGVDEFTQSHPEGFDRQVGERGSRLSAGQRQTVAIARALLLTPNILLFDEPSASMDDAWEMQLRHNLKKYLDNQTTLLLVTHKASMLDLVDRLIVMDKGQVVADGPKEMVLNALRGGVARPNGPQNAQQPKQEQDTKNNVEAKQNPPIET
jgi:ATP-binding cassette subfamily C protein LapB